MDHDKLMEELDRLLDLLGTLDPCGEKYDTVLKRYNELFKSFLAEDKQCEDDISKKHSREIESKKLELEEKRLQLEDRKLNMEERNSADKLEIEKRKLDMEEKTEANKAETDKRRIEIDLERNIIEDRKLDIQEEDNKERIRIEKEKLAAEFEEIGKKSHEAKGQAMWRLVEIGAHGVVMMAGIILTGKIQETSILDSKLWSLVCKPKF